MGISGRNRGLFARAEIDALGDRRGAGQVDGRATN